MAQFGRHHARNHGWRDRDSYPANWRVQNWGRYDRDMVGTPRGRFGGGRGYGFDEYRAQGRPRHAGYGVPYGASHLLRGYGPESRRFSSESIPGHRAGYGYDYDQYRGPGYRR